MVVDRTRDAVRRYYDAFSATYDRGRDRGYHRMVDELEASIACRYAQGLRALELGCGTGRILERVAPVAASAVGIDVSPRMASHAQARGLDVRIGDIRDLPFPDGAFDLTYAFKVLPHVPNVEQAIAEAARVTRPGGHLVLEFYNPWSLRYLARRFVGPRRVGDGYTEADIPTRWDSMLAVRGLVPEGLAWTETHGVRVFTPFAATHELPAVGPALRWAERRAASTPLRVFGGFLVTVLRRTA